MNRRLTSYPVPVLGILLLFGALSLISAKPLKKEAVDEAISKGLDFLEESQLGHGEFKTYASPDSNLKRILHLDPSPFVSTFVLYSLAFVDDERVAPMTNKALDFFQYEENASGQWRYWTSLNDKRIDPDLDDMACISFLLRRHGRRFGSNKQAFYSNRDGNGIFYTWIRDPYSKNPNDIDCVVNTNVLLYLGENSRTADACRWVTRVVREGTEIKNSVYYLNRPAVYYMISRAIREGISCLESVQDTMVNRLQSARETNGSYGDELATGFAVCALFNCGEEPDSVMAATTIPYLLKKQKWKGSWPIRAFYIAREDGIWWGSEELTTALCIEALVRFRDAWWKTEDSP